MITALIPAHNEAESISATINGLLEQTRIPDHIIIIPNGCTDNTPNIARQYDVTVMELPTLTHRKSEALNRAWKTYGQNADIIICLDADTYLPPNAIADWETEMETTPNLAGSSSKFTMTGPGILTRLQRHEFAQWTMTSLRRGYTTVLAGTGCAIRNTALHEVTSTTNREGPWSYESQVEDFELTYQIRKAGWDCAISPTVRAYTDSMKTIPALWSQRMKWQVGTVEDLLSIGLNRYTRIDWWQQAAGLLMAALRIAWVTIMIALTVQGLLVLTWYWLIIPPIVFICSDTKAAFLIPHRDKRDVLCAAALLPQEFFAWMRAAWFITAWIAIIETHITGSRKDRWELQYTAESR